ncbi:MAG: 1-deoxy-D-xylulose-5-phosphate reductoisomerase [Desulfovibrionaceae bacterium]
MWPPQDTNLCYISAAPSQAWAEESPRGLTLLGSTGSIGVNALKVIACYPQSFRVFALAGARNVRLLAEQAAQWRPAWLGVLDGHGADALKALLPAGYTPRIVTGAEGYAQLAALPEASTVLSAQVGAAGLRGTVAATLAGKVVCLANKESLVLAGGLIRDICARTGATILPVDSEHNALFQGLAGRLGKDVRRIILTASGGPFHGRCRADLEKVTCQQALNHPNWSMGAKITIDSATLMNKGLEVMEAFHLYGATLENIGVVVHPQSLVHSLVEFNDGSLMAHMGMPDMRMAIAHCLAWPRCLDSGVAPLDLMRAGTLTFAAPDLDSFPCLALARRALRERGGQSVVLNAANEAAVALFLAGKVNFMDIPALLTQAMDDYAASAPGHEPLCPALSGSDMAQVKPLLDTIERLDRHTRQKIYTWANIPM